MKPGTIFLAAMLFALIAVLGCAQQSPEGGANKIASDEPAASSIPAFPEEQGSGDEVAPPELPGSEGSGELPPLPPSLQ